MHAYEDCKRIKRIAFCLIFAAALALSIFYGSRKSGFHEDEYYTYYSSNRTYGLFQPDRQWQDRQTILDEFVVRKGEGFNYSLVKLVQSWDVHPPLYYDVFHTMCSLVPGVFTKWTGIAANLIGFAIAFIFFCLLMEEMNVPLWVEIITLIFWGMNPQTVSCNILIRMYAWLTAAIIACAFFHVKLIRDYDNNSLEMRSFVIKSLVPIIIVSFTGFLIQYFFIFFFFVIGVETAFYIAFMRKDIRNAFLYVISCGLGLGFSVLVYPASLHHMFGGYRGGDAAGSFFDIPNTWMRLIFFVGLLNDFVFAGGLIVVVLAIIIGVLYKIRFRRGRTSESKSPDAAPVILTVASLGYFLLTSKTALLVGAASNRYEMPIYGLLSFLLIWDLYQVAKSFDNKYLIYLASVVMIILLVKGHVFDRRVLFLYPEDRDKTAFASANSDAVAVVMFNPATPQNVWRLTDELLIYPKVYYMDEENTEPITDSEVISSDHIILYAADDDLQEAAFGNILMSTGLGTMEYITEEDMWTTYELK